MRALDYMAGAVLVAVPLAVAWLIARGDDTLPAYIGAAWLIASVAGGLRLMSR